MYSSEKNPGFKWDEREPREPRERKNRSFDWKDVIIKAVFLVIFLLLLLWLFPKVPNMKPFYSNVFRENIKYMQEAAESYYTDERLPKNIGDTAEITLQEMINKNLILPFVDENGEECDTLNSYVQVRKNKNDFTLKVNLVCPSEKNFVEKTLGCYTYCEKEECFKEPEKQLSLEYQFKQEVTGENTVYSCPNGGVLSNGKCYVYTTNSYKATETTIKGTEYCPNGGELKDGICYVTDIDYYNPSISKGEYYCPNGGTLNNGKCYKNGTSTYAATQTAPTYSCPNGGVLRDGVCYVNRESSYVASLSRGEYYCPNGGTLNGSRCYISRTETVSATVSYTCPSGYNKSGSICVKPGSTTKVPASIINYTCPDGRYVSTSTCTITTTTSGSSYAAKKETSTTTVKSRVPLSGSQYTSLGTTTEYVCTSSSNCPGYVTYYNYRKTITTYSCPNGGTLNNSTKMCVKSGTTTTKTVSATPNYYCSNFAKLEGDKCVTTTPSQTTAATATYTCPSGYRKSGSTCVGTVTTSYSASQSSGSYYCPNGGTLRGSRCYYDDSYTYRPTSTPGKYSCPNGGTLSGSTCVVNETQVYDASQSTGTQYCPNGGNLSGGKCVVNNSYNYASSKTDGKTVYTCPNGGELKDKKCYTNTESSSYDATATVNKVTSYRYKWSESKTLDGWYATGVTRTVEK